MKRIHLPVLVLAVALAATAQLDAYKLIGYKWKISKVIMNMRLGSTAIRLIDGAATWNKAATPGLSAWNAKMKNMQFAAGTSTGQKAAYDKKNYSFFASSAYGKAMPSNVLATAYTWSGGGAALDSDVVFNSKFKWNSYRGSLRSSSTTGIDIRRVAVHEFGHTLGLHHPNQFGQNVVAIMNSTVSNVDRLQTDDIKGAQAIYGVR
jgi:hypothetical protein